MKKIYINLFIVSILCGFHAISFSYQYEGMTVKTLQDMARLEMQDLDGTLRNGLFVRELLKKCSSKHTQAQAHEQSKNMHPEINKDLIEHAHNHLITLQRESGIVFEDVLKGQAVAHMKNPNQFTYPGIDCASLGQITFDTTLARYKEFLKQFDEDIKDEQDRLAALQQLSASDAKSQKLKQSLQSIIQQRIKKITERKNAVEQAIAHNQSKQGLTETDKAQLYYIDLLIFTKNHIKS